MDDYYKVLGVEQGASEERIKKAYKHLAQLHHPDRGGSHESFTKILNAYNALKERNFKPPDIKRYTARPIPVRVKLDISLKDAVYGGTKIFTANTKHGSFAAEIQLIPGIESGNVVRYPDVGPNNEDVYIEFNILPNSLFSKDKNDIILKQKVIVWDLLLGAVIEVPSLDGRSFNLAIPAGTQPGTTFKMKGLGIPNLGDMLVKIECVLPKTITESLKSAILAETSEEKYDTKS